MRVVHVIASCSPGGAEVFVKSLLLALKANGLDVALWVMHEIRDVVTDDVDREAFERDYVRELENSGIPVQFLGKRPRRDWIRTWWRIRKLFHAARPEIIHVHLEAVTFHVVVALMGCKTRIIQTIHNTVSRHPLTARALFSWSLVGYVAISDKVRNLAIEMGMPADKVWKIHNGIQKNQTNFTFNVRKDTRTLVTVGRLTKQKNHANLIRAFAALRDRLKDRFAEYELLIVGSGELLDELRDLTARLKLGEQVRFLGVRQDVCDLLESCDLYVLSSDWEGLSISLLEALAAGIPIVATDAGSNNEIVEDGVTGLLVPRGDSNALADAMYNLLEDEQMRRAFSYAGKKKAEAFSITLCADRHIGMYENLLSCMGESHRGKGT